MSENQISKSEVIAQLCRSPHGKYAEYMPVALRVAKEDPSFLSHLIAWNYVKGEIRDSKVALPIISLGVESFDEEFVDNSLAHLAALDPRNLMKAYVFSRDAKIGRSGRLRRMIHGYLANLESNVPRFDRVAVQHRQSLKFLYARTKAPCGEYASMVLFGRVGSRGVQPVTKCSPPKGSIFWDIANLKHMDPVEAAGTIMGRKIPFLIAIGALGEKSKNPILIQALIEQMSPAELMNNTKMLERMGLRDHPNLRAAYDKAITKAAKSKSSASFKASVAAEQVDDPILKARLQEVQEKQIQQNASIEGDWLVLADKSGSMQSAIEASRHVAGALAKMVKGKVYLMFFDTSVVAIDVTGMSYEEISAKTRTITAGGGTSIGAGLMCSMERNIRVDGIAILSDGGENASPYFHEVYPRYCKKMDADPAVYFYRMGGRSVDCFSVFMERAKIQVTTFDLAKHGVDYYALPAIAKTMRVGRYSLVDEIMNTPLMTLQEVYGKTKGASVPTSGSGNVHKGEEVYA